MRAGRFCSGGIERPTLDTRFLKHYGDMLELEKSYTLLGQEGKVPCSLAQPGAHGAL
ncbi:hypothetical protein GCM10023063_49860 [Arthrobacter methylotrophus]